MASTLHSNPSTTTLFPGCYGLDFLDNPNRSINDPRRGESTSEEREELRQMQQEAREYLKSSIDTRHAYNEIFGAVFGTELRLDSLSGTVYLRGERVESPDDLTHKLAKVIHRLPPNNEVFYKEYDRLCRVWAKNPIAAYLESLGNPAPVTEWVWQEEEGEALHVRQTIYPEPITPEGFPEWQDLAKHCFGADATELDSTLLKRWLISAVARAIAPGCKVDSALVLKGEQGIGKTSFFATLATIPNPLSRDKEPISYFGTLLPRKTIETQQEIQGLWIAEMGEVESTFRKKDISELKAFLTETADLYRAPYARQPQKHPRHTVFCATTNEDSFLTDGTGSRRFWVIDLGNRPINLEWIAENRDNIWACAYYLYRKGEQWHLTESEADISERNNQAYVSATGYEDVLAPTLAALDTMATDAELSYTLSGAEILTYLLQIPPANHAKHSRKLGETMKALGWESKKFSIGGTKLRRYYKPANAFPVFHANVSELNTASLKQHRDIN